MKDNTPRAQWGRTGRDSTVGIPTAVVIVAARLDSSRLPGKALMDLGGHPVIRHALDRAARIDGHDAVVLATTTRDVDSPLGAYARNLNFDVYRGATDDVAGRLLSCAVEREADYIVRVNGDSPFLDPELITRALGDCRANDLDFATNIPGRTFPYGVAVEIVRTAALAELLEGTDDPADREHVTPCVYRNIKHLRHTTYTSSRPELAAARLVVDTAEDLTAMRRIAAILGSEARTADYERTAQTYLDMARQASKECV